MKRICILARTTKTNGDIKLRFISDIVEGDAGFDQGAE